MDQSQINEQTVVLFGRFWLQHNTPLVLVQDRRHPPFDMQLTSRTTTQRERLSTHPLFAIRTPPLKLVFTKYPSVIGQYIKTIIASPEVTVRKVNDELLNRTYLCVSVCL
uniref:Uncharacterized protein n=1 Tax=Hyaloperonospora arabidopsidis (strain Emoy2) TaxID=559515 RepID=M4BX45_HYAAE